MLANAPIRPCIPVSDVSKARAFYEDKLGLNPGKEMTGGVQFECGNGTSLFIYESEGAGTNKGNAAAWAVDDVEKEVADLRSRGVKFEDYDQPGLKTENGIASGDGMKSAWLKDLDGNILVVAGG